MARGVNLNQPSGGGGGSDAVGRDAAAEAAPLNALRALGKTGQRIGAEQLFLDKRKRERAEAARLKQQEAFEKERVRILEERAKAEQKLAEERQKIYDSSTEAHVRNQLYAADRAIEVAKLRSPDDTEGWLKQHESGMASVIEDWKKRSGNLSDAARQKQIDLIDSHRTKSRGDLTVDVVKHEVDSNNANWRLNAQRAADVNDRGLFNLALDSVVWENDAAREKFKDDTWAAGQYNRLLHRMEFLETPDQFLDFAEQVEMLAEGEIKENHRHTLAAVARQKAAKVERAWSATFRQFNSRILSEGFIDISELTAALEENRIDPERARLIEEGIAELALKDDYKLNYDRQVKSAAFLDMEDKIVTRYINKENVNIRLDSEKLKEIIEEIDAIKGLDALAKNDLYSLAFEARTQALREPDNPWYSAIPHPFFQKDNDPVSDAEREFRLRYTNDLASIMAVGEPVVEGISKIFLENDASISKAFKEGGVDAEKLYKDLMTPFVKNITNQKLKRRLAANPNFIASLGAGQSPEASPEQQEPVMVNTQEEFDKLPSGALYREPDGNIYRKP